MVRKVRRMMSRGEIKKKEKRKGMKRKKEELIPWVEKKTHR